MTDMERGEQAWLDLADELTGPDLQGIPYVEEDWDPASVKAADEWSATMRLPFPPPPDIDRALAMVASAKRRDREEFER